MDNLLFSLRYFLGLSGQLILLFIGVSFLVGLLQEYIPPQKIQKVMGFGQHKLVGNIIGASFGALTPFCSCSTIPILLGLLKSKASFSASMSFLMASPLLNPVIIALLLALFGLRDTLIYVSITFPVAVLVGLWWDKMGLSAHVKNVRLKQNEEACAAGSGEGLSGSRAGRALQGAIDIFRQVFPWLLLGSAVGSAIYGFVPEEWIIRVAGPHNPLAIPVAAVAGVPLYIRAETILPISSVLLDKGMGIGAVMALIIGGSGASLPEVTMMGAIFKRKLLLAYLITIMLMAVLAGLLFMLLS